MTIDVTMFHAQGLTGGGDALDGYAAATLGDGDFCLTFDTDKLYVHQYDATATDAESSPTVIRPNDYSSAGVWKLLSSPYGDLQVQPEIVSGLPVEGGITGGDISRASDTTLTITPVSCLDSGQTTKLYTSSNTTFTVPHTGSIAANTIYHIFLVKLSSGGTFEFRTYTSEAAGASDGDVAKYRWIGFWRTNGSSQLVQGFYVDGLMLFGKASENVVSASITTSFSTVNHSSFIPDSRISWIKYGVRDGSTSDAILASDDGTNISAYIGGSNSSTSDTDQSAWGKQLLQSMSLIPYYTQRYFKSTGGTLDLLIHMVKVRR